MRLFQILILWVAGLLAGAAAAQDRLPATRSVQSGHSLTDGIIAPLSQMIRATSIRGGALHKATIPGSPMDWRWSNATDPDIRRAEIMERYDVLVITERVPLSGTFDAHNSPEWASRWVNHAWSNGQARSVIYATWVETDSGPGADNPYNDPDRHLTFRARLPIEMKLWQTILDHANSERPDDAPEVALIPGPLMVAEAYDQIEAGRAPGLSEIEDLFLDTIHVNPLGAYLIALAHYAVIFDRDPRGLPHGVPARGGPTAEQAAWMQQLVWDVLQR